jgi:hypothetical protein
MAGWVELAQMRGYLSAGTGAGYLVRKVEVVFCVEYLLVRGREMVCWYGAGRLAFWCALDVRQNKNAADMTRPRIKWR